MAAIYYDTYVPDFTFTLYGDWTLNYMGIEVYISWGFPFLIIFRANGDNDLLYLAIRIYLGYL